MKDFPDGADGILAEVVRSTPSALGGRQPEEAGGIQ